MPKKKPIAKRLKNLFEDVKPEQAPAEPKPASRKRAAPEKPVQPIEPKPVERVTQPVEMVSQAAYQDSVMSLAFQAGQNSWATLQVVDETEPRKWSQDEQLLVKQVADQLSLALENARLFNETQARAEELSVLNEMGRELSSQLEAQAIAETVYRYTSRLMDTSNFYVALYDEKKDEKSYPVMVEEGRQFHVEPSKLGNRGFSDYIIRNKRVVFAPNDVLGQMKSLGIEFVPLDKDDTPSQCWLGVPILIGERVLGLISVQSVKTSNAYDVHDRDILTTIASQAAIALENARLFQETQASAEELSVLNEMGRELTAQLEIASIAEVVYRFTGRLMDTSNFFLALYDEKNQEKIFPLAFEEGKRIQMPTTKLGNRTFSDYIIRNKKVIFAPHDVQGYRQSLGIEFIPLNRDPRPSLSMMGVPLMIGERVLGLISVQSVQQADIYTEHHRDILTTIASQAAIALENARLFQEAQRRAQETAILAEVGREISVTLDLETVLTRIASYAIDLFQAVTSAVYLPEAEGTIWRAIAVIGADAEEIKNDPVRVGEGVLGKIVLLRTGQIVNDASSQAGAIIVKGTEERPYEHVLGVPVLSADRVTGLMSVWRTGQGREFTQAELEFLTSLARQAAIAIQNARLFNEVTTSQSQLSEALQIARLGYFEIDPEKQSVRLTNEFYALLGTTAEKEGGYQFPLHETLQKFVLDEDIRAAYQAVQDAINTKQGSEVSSEVRYKTSEGKVIWISSTYKVEHDTQGRPIKVAGSSQDITERKTNELIQSAITQISESALTARTMTELIKSVHEAIAALVPARNFYVALYDPASGLITFPYRADEVDTEWSPRRLGKGLTSYVIRTGKSLRVTPEIFAELETAGEVAVDGVLNVDWLGVPLRTKQVVTGVIALQTYDRKIRITEEHKEILSVIAGQVASAIERFLAEREIQKFKLGIDRSDNAVFITDLDGTIQYANPAFEKIYGYAPEEAIGKTPRILKSGLLSAEEYKHFWETLLAGETISHVITNKSKDGRLIPIAGTYTPILDETGEILGFLALNEDITERKLSEETLKRRNDYLAASSEIGRLVTSTLDLNTIFTRTVNLIRERFGFYFASIYIIEETGFSAILREGTGEAGEKMRSQRHSVIVGSNSVVGKVAESIEPMLVNDTELEPLYTPNPFLLETRSEVAIPLRIGLRIVGVIDIQSTDTHAFSQDDLSVLQSLADQVAVAIDNARSFELSQQLVRELREVDALKSQFLANMSHELRTPLNSIIGFSRVILKGIDGPISEMQQQDLTAIYNSGGHLLGLINDILDLARIEAGKMELNYEEVHLTELATSVMSTAKGLVKEKPIQLQQRIPANMPSVRGDTMRVRQVLLNLIANAAKFTDEGSITVETVVQKGPTDRMEALINVIDTGPGISEEDQKKLFQAFSQVDGSATRKSGGSGLGLSICANLVQLHGGRIGVHSQVGKGSTFWFTLPLYHQPEQELPTDKKIVLAIDDDPQVISLYERYLSLQGYYVVPVTDPAAAKEQVLKIRPYAITLDIMMPNKDGWSVLTDLKSDPTTRDFPVIICSIVDQADRGFSLGAADYLVKPILEEDLVCALDRLNKSGTIHEVLVIDDDVNDLRLMEKILTQHGRYKPILAEGGRKGWEAIRKKTPQAIILDIFMPEMDGFLILEKLREDPKLKDIPVLVVSGGGLTVEQQQQLNDFGQRLITKGSLNEGQLIESIENALKRFGP